jgi:hypothetical protein
MKRITFFLLGALTALVVALAFGCADPRTGPPQPPGLCLPGVRPTAVNTCGNLITPDLQRCRECEQGSGCYVDGDDVYCVRRDVSCADPWCSPSPIPIGLRRAPRDGGT